MALGSDFDPDWRLKSELYKRAKRALISHVEGQPQLKGIVAQHAVLGPVLVTGDDDGLVVRLYHDLIDVSTSQWTRVYVRQRDGYESVWNQELAVQALDYLRSVQVLDDLALA